MKTSGRKPRANLEDQEQRTLFEWAAVVKLPPADDVPPGARLGTFLYAVPNGGKRSRIEAAIMQGLGTRPGIPDVALDLARLGYHGLRLEMKKRRRDFRSPAEARAAVSAAQRERIDLLRGSGYFAAVAYGFAEAHVLLCDYLGMVPDPAVLGEALSCPDFHRITDLIFGGR